LLSLPPESGFDLILGRSPLLFTIVPGLLAEIYDFELRLEEDEVLDQGSSWRERVSMESER